MMKKSILNLGKALNKAEQKQINGGFIGCSTHDSGYCENPSDCEQTNGGKTMIFWRCIQNCCVMS